jgi:hypothetical protein
MNFQKHADQTWDGSDHAILSFGRVPAAGGGWRNAPPNSRQRHSRGCAVDKLQIDHLSSTELGFISIGAGALQNANLNRVYIQNCAHARHIWSERAWWLGGMDLCQLWLVPGSDFGHGTWACQCPCPCPCKTLNSLFLTPFIQHVDIFPNSCHCTLHLVTPALRTKPDSTQPNPPRLPPGPCMKFWGMASHVLESQRA